MFKFTTYSSLPDKDKAWAEKALDEAFDRLDKAYKTSSVSVSYMYGAAKSSAVAKLSNIVADSYSRKQFCSAVLQAFCSSKQAYDYMQKAPDLGLSRLNDLKDSCFYDFNVWEAVVIAIMAA